jgi:hypothetical protein
MPRQPGRTKGLPKWDGKTKKHCPRYNWYKSNPDYGAPCVMCTLDFPGQHTYFFLRGVGLRGVWRADGSAEHLSLENVCCWRLISGDTIHISED